MNRRKFIKTIGAAGATLYTGATHAANPAALTLVPAQAGTAKHLPNIVYIMSDELAYYELSHMGNPRIRTPRIDRMATEGIRFTQALAGAPVCAHTSRCWIASGTMSELSILLMPFVRTRRSP